MLTYTLIGAAPVLAWTIEVVRRVATGEEPIFPDFDDWKTHRSLGAKVCSGQCLVAAAAFVCNFSTLSCAGFEHRAGSGCFCLVSIWDKAPFRIGFLAALLAGLSLFLTPIMAALAQGNSPWQAANPSYLGA
ncbi:MAG: DUF4013 domain-containing protein [Anaerolineales bacterium]|nr:DUF4013 domain-containing protein [Anaerolineales bacterium]